MPGSFASSSVSCLKESGVWGMNFERRVNFYRPVAWSRRAGWRHGGSRVVRPGSLCPGRVPVVRQSTTGMMRRDWTWQDGAEPNGDRRPAGDSNSGQVQPRDVGDQSRGRLRHLLLCHFLRLLEGFIDCGDDEILEHLYVIGVDHFFLYLDLQKLLFAVHGDRHHPPACLSRDALPLQLGLHLGHLLLHLLHLFHHPLEIRNTHVQSLKSIVSERRYTSKDRGLEAILSSIYLFSPGKPNTRCADSLTFD